MTIKRLIHVMLIITVAVASCKKASNDPKREEEEDEPTNFPEPAIANNKIKVVEATAGFPAAELESDLSYVLAENQGTTVVLRVVASQVNGTPISLIFSKGLPSAGTAFDLRSPLELGDSGVGLFISYGGVTYSSTEGKLYARKNNGGTTTFYFNNLNLKGTLGRSKNVHARFTISGNLVIDGNQTKNNLVN